MHRANSHISKGSISVGIVLALVIGLVAMIPSVPLAAASGDTEGSDTPDKLNFVCCIEDDDALAYVTEGGTFTYEDVRPGVDALVEILEIRNQNNDEWERLDQRGETDEEDRWIDASIDQDGGSTETTSRFKISFFNEAGPVTFDTLRINAYDIDNGQFVEFENIDSWELTQETLVTADTMTNARHQRFTSMNVAATEDPANHNAGPYSLANPNGRVSSFGEARVRVTFVNVSGVIIKMGLPETEDGGSQQFDFGLGKIWTNKNSQRIEGFLPLPPTIGDPIVESGGTPAPMVALVSPLATTNPPRDRNVSLFGTNFDKVTEVFVGGKKLKIRKQTATQIDIRLPRGLSGLVDLELKSTLNNVLSPRHFNFGGVASSTTKKAELIVGGFAHNSRVLTPRMQARIDRWLERNSDLGTLTCTGFTSLPRRTTDVALSTKRGATACNFSERQRPELETSVSQGIEDPRPGSNVRRVKLVLTP